VERIDLPKRDDGTYAHFPDDPALADFDRSDRKFAALARNAKAPVATATDSDWLNHRAALVRHAIAVDFICGCDPAGWFA
jgi:imidazolonepropionase-like amidohydrolase